MTWTNAILLLTASIFFSTIPVSAQDSKTGGGLIALAQPTATNSPYVVVQETERTQTLSDGTHIITRSQTRLYRDSYGRTRSESFGMSSNDPSDIQINDPIAGTTYILHVQQRVAQLLAPLRKLPINPNVVQVRPAQLPEQFRPATVREDLGSQLIDGIAAVGIRITTTTPIDSEGNDRPIVNVHETWTSSDLGLTILEKSSDPRFGDSITRITSLDRSEPDPSLFQVPPDYIVQDPSAK